MSFTEPTYLDLLRATLIYDEARRARAAELLTEDAQYRELVLTQWDRVIAQDKQRIIEEEAKEHATLSPDS